jgi:hypothetical protein
MSISAPVPSPSDERDLSEVDTSKIGRVYGQLRELLDTPEKVEAILAFAEFCRVDLAAVNHVFNSLIIERDSPLNRGHVVLRYGDYTPEARVAGMLAAYTQAEPSNARRLFLPGMTYHGYNGGGLAYFGWGPERPEDVYKP